MNLLHVTRFCPAKSVGGTERYIFDLCQELRRWKVESRIAWLTNWQAQQPFRDDCGIDYVPLPCGASPVDVAPAQLLRRLQSQVMAAGRPEVLHFHTFGLSEARLADWALGAGIPYTFTYHSPGWSCRRGDLLRWGRQICHGEVRPWRCSACMVQQRVQGPPTLAWTLTAAAAPLGLTGRFTRGKLHRRTAFIADTARFGQRLRHFLQNAAAVVACCQWSIPVLQRNGAARERIVLCAQGVPTSFLKAAERRQSGMAAEASEADRRDAVPGERGYPASAEKPHRGREAKVLCDPAPADFDGRFVVGYVGRVTRVKGVHILVEAFARTSYPNARLKVYGWDHSRSGARYRRLLEGLAGGDPRIAFIRSLPFERMIAEYRKLSLLAIPSVWRETGPLTLLEAAQLGVPVWGSDRIGQIAALRKYGRMIAPNDAPTWRRALEKVFHEHRCGRWRAASTERKLGDVRTMTDVAGEMMRVYARISRH